MGVYDANGNLISTRDYDTADSGQVQSPPSGIRNVPPAHGGGSVASQHAGAFLTYPPYTQPYGSPPPQVPLQLPPTVPPLVPLQLPLPPPPSPYSCFEVPSEEWFPRQFDPLIGNAIRELTEQLQVRAALATNILMGVLSAVTFRLADVSFNGGTWPAGVNTNAIAEPGDGKGAVFDLLTPPLYEFDRPRNDAFKSDKAKYLTQVADRAQTEKGLLRCLRISARDKEKTIEIQRDLDLHRAQPLTEPVDPRVLHDSISFPALWRALNGTNRHAALIMEEAGPFWRGPFNELINKALSGSSFGDEKAHNSIEVIDPRLVVVSAVQPDVFDAAMKKNPVAWIGSGFCARFFHARPESIVRDGMPNKNPGPYILKLHQRMRELLQQSSQPGRHVLTASHHAYSLCDRINRDVAQLRQPGGLLEKSYFAKRFVEHTVRLASVTSIVTGRDALLSEKAIDQAQQIARYSAFEDVRICAPTGEVPELVQAMYDVEYFLIKKFNMGLRYVRWTDICKGASPPRQEARYRPAVFQLQVLGKVRAWPKSTEGSTKPTECVELTDGYIAQLASFAHAKMPRPEHGFFSWNQAPYRDWYRE